MDHNGKESSPGKSPPPEESQEQDEKSADSATTNDTILACSDEECTESCTEDDKVEPRPPKISIPETDSEPESSSHSQNPRNQKWSEALKAKLFASVDKESNIFSYMFLDKIFGEARPCRFCGARGTAKLPPGDDSLKLCVLEDGIVGRQNVFCSRCGEIDTVVSCDDPKRFPSDDRLCITGSEIRSYCRKITHYEILHDLMEMLHIAATDNDSQRQEKHHEVADFMLKNVRKVCEEWCRPEYAELRLKKYLRLRDETLLTTYNPTFTPDCTEEYKEMYEMMANSFRQNRDKVLLLLQLMKESLIDSPTRSTFMMWVSIAMMHSESYSQFKAVYDPRSFMRVDSSEYQALQDRYLALEVPLGIKKIPVIFILFEIPRFYHYVEFMNQRQVKKKGRSYLCEEEREVLQRIEEEAMKMGLKMKPRTGKMVSPEAHLDFLTRQEEYGREMIYQSCRDKEKVKQQKIQNALKAATSVRGKHPSPSATSDGSTSPSTSRKSDSSKTSSPSSSKDSTSQGSKSFSSSNGTTEKDRSATGGSEGSRPFSNKKKRKKNRNASSEGDNPPTPSVEEHLTKKVEDESIKRRDEFISNDDFHAILRKSVAESEARRGVVTDGDGDGAEKKKSRSKKRSRKDSKEKEMRREEKSTTSEEKDKLSKDEAVKEGEKEAAKLEKVEELKKERYGKDGEEKKDDEDGEKMPEDVKHPKAIKPEVNPESPFANISLPPQQGADPSRKPISLPSLEPTSTPSNKYTTRSSLKKELREQMKAHRRHKKSGRDSRTVICAQVDTEMLRAQGYKISGDCPVTTVVAGSDGTIEHILEGFNTPEQVKTFLGRKYSILNQHAGSGYLTMPSRNNPGALVVDPGKEINPFVNSAATKFSETSSEPKLTGNPKKRKKAKLAQHEEAISSLMECYAYQRRQCQPGGWKDGREGELGVIGTVAPGAGVLDRSMCSALGGGDLSKALSTAYKGAIAKAESEGADDISELDVGWSGIGSYRIHSDGSVTDVKSCDRRGSGTNSESNTDSESGSGSPTSEESGHGKEKNGSGSTGSDKSGSDIVKGVINASDSTDSSKDKKSGSGSTKDEKSGSGSTKDEKKGDQSGSGSTKDEKSGSGSTKDEKSGSGFTKDEKSGSSSTKDEKSRSGSTKDEKSGSGSTKDEKKDNESGSGSTKDEKKDEKGGNGSMKDKKNGSGTTKDEKSGSGSTKDEKSGSGSTKDEKSGSGATKDEKSGNGATKDTSKSGSGSTKDEKSATKDSFKSASGLSRETIENILFNRRRDIGRRGLSRTLANAKSKSASSSVSMSKSGYMRGSNGMRFLCKPVKDKYCVANPDDLIPDGLMSTSKWSETKRDLFKNCMCRGLDERVYTVDSEEEARAIFLKAMQPTDLGKLEGPCPRYIVPSDGGVGHLTGRFNLPDVGSDIKDLADFLRSPAAPRQQMTVLDAMRFPYKLETTKVYIHRWDEDGHPMPDKVTMVSKVTMLPKELADRYCCVGDAGSIMELTDTEDDEDLFSATTIDDDLEKMLEIEAPPSKADPPPKVITAGEISFDSPSDMAVDTLSKMISESLSKNSRLRNLPISVESISQSIMEMLNEPQTAEMIRPSIEDDDEPGITLPDSASAKKTTKKKKFKKKPKKMKPTAPVVTERAPSPRHDIDEAPVSRSGEEVGVVDTPPITPSAPATTTTTTTSTTTTSSSTATSTTAASPSATVRDIDDIDDIDIGVSEDLLKGKGIKSATCTTPSVATSTTSPLEATSKTSQSKVVAREKFRLCENCGSVIDDRILVCSGCKKVAYCNRKCQKAHWKSHKRVCSHRASKEDCTG